MEKSIKPINKLSLSDNLAQNISRYIYSNRYSSGDRLPSIAELSRLFGVGQPTMREAIKKLEAYGVLVVKHGSGIYVSDNHNRLFVSNPIVLKNIPIKKILLDLIDARLSIEMQTVTLASTNISSRNIERMEAFLEKSGQNFENDEILNSTNMSFHLEIAAASGNVVLHQLLGVLMSLYRDEQKILLHVYRSKEEDHKQHIEIFEALRDKNETLALERIKHHLIGVRESIQGWNPTEQSRKTLNLNSRELMI
jgi:GntR family transcriptional regulator, transcriptional repressor for pyruvate dehydrogenase complex